MLVINRIKLDSIDQIGDVRKFEHDRPFRLQECFETSNEIVNIRHMCKHICRIDKISATMTGNEVLRHLLPEEPDGSGDALFLRDPGYIERRVHTDDWHTKLLEMLKQVSVITANIDN